MEKNKKVLTKDEIQKIKSIDKIKQKAVNTGKIVKK